MGQDVLLIDTGDAIAKRLMILSQNAGHINEGELDILVLYTGTINTSMVKMILKKNKFELRKCEI